MSSSKESNFAAMKTQLCYHDEHSANKLEESCNSLACGAQKCADNIAEDICNKLVAKMKKIEGVIEQKLKSTMVKQLQENQQPNQQHDWKCILAKCKVVAIDKKEVNILKVLGEGKFGMCYLTDFLSLGRNKVQRQIVLKEIKSKWENKSKRADGMDSSCASAYVSDFTASDDDDEEDEAYNQFSDVEHDTAYEEEIEDKNDLAYEEVATLMLLSKFGHPGIVSTITDVDDNGILCDIVVYEYVNGTLKLFIIMEYIEGTTLSEAATSSSIAYSSGSTEPDDASGVESSSDGAVCNLNPAAVGSELRLKVSVKVADTLHFLHMLGLKHWDLHGKNVIIRNDGNPVLVDLGGIRFKKPSSSRKLFSDIHAYCYKVVRLLFDEDILPGFMKSMYIASDYPGGIIYKQDADFDKICGLYGELSLTLLQLRNITNHSADHMKQYYTCFYNFKDELIKEYADAFDSMKIGEHNLKKSFFEEKPLSTALRYPCLQLVKEEGACLKCQAALPGTPTPK